MRCGLRLILGQIFGWQVRIEIGKRGVARAFFFADAAQFDQTFDHRLRDAGSFGKFAKGQGQAAQFLKRGQDAATGIGFPFGAAFAQTIDFAHRGRIAQAGCAGGKAQHRGHRCQGIIACFRQEGLHFFAHRRGVERSDH